MFSYIAFAASAGCSRSSGKGGPGDTAGIPAGNIVRIQAPVAPPCIPLVSLPQGQGVQVIWYKSMNEATQRIIEGKADVSIIPVNSMALLYNKGVQVQLGAVSTWGILYLVSGDPGVREWKDLKGKSVAVGARGFSPDLVFRGLLLKNGLKAGEDVNVFYGTSSEIAQMVVAGKLLLAVLPEPLLTSVLAKNGQVKIIMNLEQEWEKAFPEIRGLPQAGLAVSKKFVQEQPAAWQQFSRNYAQSLEAYVENPEKIGPQEEKVFDLPAEIIKQSLDRSSLKFQSGRESIESVHRYLSQIQLIDPDAIGGKVPDKEGDFYL